LIESDGENPKIFALRNNLMKNNSKNRMSNQEAKIASKIIVIRNENVILDLHLAEFYHVETRALKQAVRRNPERFPSDFMFELSDNEIDEVVSQNVIPSKKHFGGARPFAFTENGVAMLSGVLKSRKAIEINIAVIRAFTMLRKLLKVEERIVFEIEHIKKVILENKNNIQLIFKYLEQFEKLKEEQLNFSERRRIGFKR
jgi:hypothetical protein